MAFWSSSIGNVHGRLHYRPSMDNTLGRPYYRPRDIVINNLLVQTTFLNLLGWFLIQSALLNMDDPYRWIGDELISRHPIKFYSNWNFQLSLNESMSILCSLQPKTLRLFWKDRNFFEKLRFFSLLSSISFFSHQFLSFPQIFTKNWSAISLSWGQEIPPNLSYISL